jgi:starvation-inducible DNA-binding protein
MSTRGAKLKVLNAVLPRSSGIDLPLDVRQRSIESLNGVVAEIIDLAMAARHAHWNVRGSGFIAMHELFETMRTELDRHADALGERIAALGGIAGGTLQSVAGETALDPYPTLACSQTEHLNALAVRLSQVGSAARYALEEANRSPDAVTAHHLAEAAATVDKLLWILESHLPAPQRD